ncbi:MAG TPA: methyltransferase domain-containing protein [Polyangiales bacterium]|jgi:ubiquinone/menaquinone biosynthesis C-methylase UbiE
MTRQSARAISFELDSPELAQTYDRVSDRQFDHGKVLIEALAPQSGEQVLDVGCGTGRLGDHVASLVAPTGEVFGIDPLPLRIDLAARKHPRFHAQVGRAEDLSAFPTSRFDVLYANSVLHWIADKPCALGEAWRVLKSGGRIGVNSADADRAHQSAGLVRDAVIEEGLRDLAEASTFGTDHRVTGDELARLLNEAGFRDVRVTPHTFVDRVRDVDDLIAWSLSSSFGNFLAGLDDSQRARVRERLKAKLEALRSREGIRLERYLVFATARKG